MPYKYQLSDAKADLGLKSISNVCSSSAQFIQYVNEAQRRLLRRGEWFDTNQVFKFCVSGCIIAWPRWVGTVIGVRYSNCLYSQPSQLFNSHWSYVGPHWSTGILTANAVIEDANPGPCANEINGTTGKLLRYYVVKQSDVGKTMTVFGAAYGGQPLQEQVNGVWKDGITLTAGMPYGTNPTYVTNITAITRDATDGMAYLFQYDPTANALRDLAAFEPSDTNPRIRRSRIISRPVSILQPGNSSTTSPCWTNLEAMVKLEFIPVVHDRDFLLIDNFDALKFMIQAIKCEEANDDQGAEIKVIKAIRELNFDLRSKNPTDQTPVRVDAIMSQGRMRNPL